jgi:hypothetical protein
MRSLCGPGEITRLHNGAKVAQLMQFHVPPRLISIAANYRGDRNDILDR